MLTGGFAVTGLSLGRHTVRRSPTWSSESS